MAKYNDITSFLTAVNALLEDNTSGNITAQDMRTVMKDIADTFGFKSGELSDVRLRFNTVNTNTIQVQKRSDTGGWQDAGQLNIGTIQKFNTLINSFGAQLQLTGGKNELALVTQKGITPTPIVLDLGRLPKWANYYTKGEADNMFAHTSNVHSIEDLIYTQDFRTALAERIGRYKSANDSTFFIDNSLKWAYPQVDDPAYQDGTDQPVKDFDFSNFYGKWVTIRSNISSPSGEDLVVSPKTVVDQATIYTFTLIEVRDHPIKLVLETTSDFVGDKAFNLSVGWHTILFLRQADTKTRITHKPFVDKLVLDAWTNSVLTTLINNLSSIINSLPTRAQLLWRSFRTADNLALLARDVLGNDLSSTITIEDTDFIRKNYPKINTTPYSIHGTGFEILSRFSTEVVVTSNMHFDNPNYIALKQQGNTPIKNVNLTVAAQGKLYFVYNKGNTTVVLKNDGFPDGQLSILPYRIWAFNTGFDEWFTSNQTSINENDLGNNLKAKINQSGGGSGGTDTTQLPFASTNRGLNLEQFTEVPFSANLSLDQTHSAAITGAPGNTISGSTIQLQDIGISYRIWNKGAGIIRLQNNKFPANTFDLPPASIYLFKHENDRWHIANLVPINDTDLSNVLKNQSAFLSAGRLMRYWNTYGRTPDFTGDPAAWDTMSVEQFITHTVEGVQYPTIALTGSRNTEYHAFRQGNNFTQHTEALFSIPNSGVTTLFVWNQFADHFLEVGFVSVNGHPIVNVSEIFGTDAKTSPNVLEPGEARMFFLHRKDVTSQGNLSRELDATKTLARNPFKPPPRFFGQGTIDTINIKNGAITQDKIADGVGRRYAQLFCDAIKLDNDGNTVAVTAQQWILITGTWKLPDTLPNHSLMRVTTFGSHYSMETTHNVGISANEDNSVWTYYDPLHIGGEQWSYGWKPPSNTDFALVIQARDFNKINQQPIGNHKFSIYIEDLGVPNSILLTSITGVFFGSATVTSRVLSLSGRTDVTNILDISQSTFNL